MFNKLKFKASVIEAGKTMEDVAKHLGINGSTLYRKVNGSSEFTRGEIQAICVFLNLESPVDIFFDEKLTETQK